MRLRLTPLALVAALTTAVPGLALAQDRERGPEVRFGVLQHDVIHPSDRESGVDVQLQLLGGPTPRLPLLGTPRPVLVLNGNAEGETSFAAVGLAWDKRFTDRLTGELQFGYAVHDGITEGQTPAERMERLQLGSRDLFRTSLAVDYKLNRDWSIGVQWDHLSHGEILGTGSNQGMDNAGIRIGRRF